MLPASVVTPTSDHGLRTQFTEARGYIACRLFCWLVISEFATSVGEVVVPVLSGTTQ